MCCPHRISGTAPLTPIAWSSRGRRPIRLRHDAEHQLVTPKAQHEGIQTRRLDDLAGLEGLEDIDLIKIDIQGGELDVFRAATQF